MKVDELHYDGNKILSYSYADIYQVVSARGPGKSFFFKGDCIERYLKNGEQFLYLRRSKSELPNPDKFFDNALKTKYFPEWDFQYNRKKLWIKSKDEKRWNELGYICFLQQSKTFKGVNYEEIGTIIFDEFMIDDSNKIQQRYMKNEVEVLFDLYESIARLRPVRLIMLSNARAGNNPYFIHFNITNDIYTVPGIHKIDFPLPDSKDPKHPDLIRIVLDIYENEKYDEIHAQSRAGRLMRSSRLAQSGIHNKFIDDNDFNVEKMPKKAQHCINIIVDKKMYGGYITKDDRLFFSEKSNPSSPRSYFCTQDDARTGAVFIRSSGQNADIKALKKLMSENRIYYDTLSVKFAVTKFFGYLNII